MKKTYAEVIVDISHERLDRPFTYSVPAEMAPVIVPGSVVRVPFGGGGRVISGYVVNVTDRCSVDPEKIKPIAELMTDSETAESRLVALAAWMSRSCGSTMIQALKTVVPAKRKYAALTERTVTLGSREAAQDYLALAKKKNWKAKARVVAKLLDCESCSMQQLLKEAGVPLAVVRGLEDEGIVAVASSELLRKMVRDAEVFPADKLTPEQEAAVSAIREEWSSSGWTAAPADEPPKNRCGSGRTAARSAVPNGEQTEKRGAGGRTVLLTGVTGSGKTVVYTELIADALAQGKQAIVLIPEIALTRQTVLRFVRRFGDKVSFLHSRLSGGERYDQQKAAKNGDISVMVGPRSALFTPFQNLGLIIIDEEHEETYHSETVPRYHARETAEKRAELEGAHVLLGSATPSMTACFRAEKGIYRSVRLTGRYGGSRLPETEIVDMRKELENGNRSILSDTLREGIASALSKKEQVMLFLNRRGYTGCITCRSCGAVIKCPHCDVSLTRHRGGQNREGRHAGGLHADRRQTDGLYADGRLVCHYCGYETSDVSVCPTCGSSFIGGITTGTEQVEELLHREFPDAAVLRMDADTTRGKDGHGRILSEFGEGKADILIGTQMIVKGHDFPNVTLVGMLLADLSLSDADYRSAERTYALIAQAVGRAGRGRKAGRAVIQTYRPEHYAVIAGARQDQAAFYKEEMLYRSILEYPPAGAMAAIYGSSEDENLLAKGMRFIKQYIGMIDPQGRLRAIGPAPQTVGKIKDQYRQAIYIRNKDPEQLIRAKDRIEEYIAINSGFAKIRIQFDFQV